MPPEFGQLAMENLIFTSSSGRKLFFEQLHIELSGLGFLEGKPELIRAEVLRMIPGRISRKYGNTGLLLREPPAGQLPRFTFFAQLHSHAPIKPGFDCSSMVVVWFAEALPGHLATELAAQINGIDWERHAKDGNY